VCDWGGGGGARARTRWVSIISQFGLESRRVHARARGRRLARRRRLRLGRRVRALHSGQRDSERHGGGDALVARQLGEGGVHLVGDALVLLLLVDELVCR